MAMWKFYKEVDGTSKFGTGYYTVEELEALNQIAEGYY